MTAAAPLVTPSARHDLLGVVLAWVTLLVVGLLTRPPIPVDETRYLSVAWEMWQRGDLLVPHLLGEPYHHKPPLLFWGMHLGWWLFGVSEWWARCVAPLFGLATLVLTWCTARTLWPQRPEVARMAPWLLIGAGFWALFATLTMFDLLIAACALAGGLGLVLAALHGRMMGFALCALAIATGILAKGPVVLLHLLPLMATAPWWAAGTGWRWWRWSLACLATVIVGGGLALTWVLPAAHHGGETYADALLWHQTTGRISGAEDAPLNAHQHGWWWFLPFVPVVLLPWAVWPPAWHALTRLHTHLRDPGVRWCLCWCVPTFILHSLISGKQVHYLIPLVAPALLLLARLLDGPSAPLRRRDLWPVLTLFVVMALVLLVVPVLDGATLAQLGFGNQEAAVHDWGRALGWLPGLLVLGLLVLLIAHGHGGMQRTIRVLSAIVIVLLVVLHLAFARAVRPAYDLGPLAQRIAQWQDAGVAVGRVGTYRAEYQFLGRLTAPPQVVPAAQIADWAQLHPDGRLLMTFSARRPAPVWMGPPAEDRPHRGVRLGIWRGADVLAHLARSRE